MSAELILPQNGLNTSLKKTQIRDKILIQLKQFEEIENFKIDSEFIKLICNLIEYYVKKKYNINKKDLFFDIYYKIFPKLTEDEKQSVIKIIQFVSDNNHIKKLSYSKLIINFIGDWLKKKIL